LTNVRDSHELKNECIVWNGDVNPDVTMWKTLFQEHGQEIRRGADKSLAFPICSTTKRIFLGWVEEVRTTKS
jgi:hypothetical protein